MKKAGKVSLLLTVALVLSLGLAASSWAQPMGMMGKGMGRGHWMMNLTPEQAGKLFDLKEKFHNDTAALRKQMWVKRAEMAALWKAQNPDEKAILAKQKELNTVREQLQQKRMEFMFAAKKIAPNFGMGWHGMGRGMGGGCGFGPGGMGMGPGAPGMMAPPSPAPAPAAPAKAK